MASSTPLSQANTSFSLALLKQLSKDNQSGNVLFSPFSISSALATVMLGARRNTALQMSECLKTQDCQDDVHSSFAQLLSELNKPGAAFALSVANRLYGEQSYQFDKDFLTQIRKHYKAELEPVDFKTRFEEVRININCWVEKQTQGKIKDIVGETALNELTRLLLVSAIYFKGTWEEPFLRFRTDDAEFRLNKRDTKPVKMMRQKKYFPFAFIQDVNCQILEMPYKGKELSMLIFLPKEIQDDTTGLEKLEKELTYGKFVAWTHPDKMEKLEVDVRLPRFTMMETYDLSTVLTSMGMGDAFDHTKCDFSGMSECKDLVLSKVSHKAFVEVNEEGTDTAPATTWYMETQSCNLRLKYFTADHPFLFFIRHNTTMSILFAGRFCRPV